MKTVFTLLFCFFSILVFPASDSIQTWINTGNEAYKNKEFEKSTEAYTKVLGQNVESAELYYNLGNACFKMKDYTRAILYYEKALKLNPKDEDIIFNLNLVRSRFVVDEIESLPKLLISKWMRDFVAGLHTDSWAWLSILSFIICLILLGLFFFMYNVRIRKISFFAAILLFLFSFFTFIFAARQKKELTANNTAIIFTPTVTVKSAPGESATDLFVLHEGTKVGISDSEGEWVEIKLTDGKVGWLKAETMEVI